MAQRGGAFHALFLTEQGMVLSFGATARVDKTNITDESVYDLVEVSPLPIVEEIIVGGDGEGCSAAITRDGTAYVWGRNHSHELGVMAEDIVSTPIQIPNLQVKKISFGIGNTLFLDSTSTFYH
jgi:alpha-tubulin suppressor-like RCC1 family protein